MQIICLTIPSLLDIEVEELKWRTTIKIQRRRKSFDNRRRTGSSGRWNRKSKPMIKRIIKTNMDGWFDEPVSMGPSRNFSKRH